MGSDKTPLVKAFRGKREMNNRKNARSSNSLAKQNPLLEISASRSDDSELVGRLPADVPLEFLRGAYRARNPVKAIRAKCLDCCCAQVDEVRKCVSVDCPSWPFRMGSNPFRKKPMLSKAERGRRAALLSTRPHDADMRGAI